MSEFTSTGRLKFPSMSADAFVSPADRAALQDLHKIPLLQLLIRKFNELGLERMIYLQTTAEAVRCGPRQYRSLHAMLREACEILETPEPELYLKYDDTYGACTAGVNRSFIVLNSGLVNEFSDDELLFLIGHEVAHVKCGHALYLMLSRLLVPLVEALGDATLGLGRLAGMGLVSGFYEWTRQAAFLADRAGLLVCQDSHVALNAVMKLGSGATRFDEDANQDLFLEQAREYTGNSGVEGMAKVALFLLYTWQLEHPQAVHRAKSLDLWIRSGAYERILSGEYPRSQT